jgi:hypothetical protein
MDLETQEISGELSPLCISVYIAKQKDNSSALKSEAKKTFTI